MGGEIGRVFDGRCPQSLGGFSRKFNKTWGSKPTYVSTYKGYNPGFPFKRPFIRGYFLSHLVPTKDHVHPFLGFFLLLFSVKKTHTQGFSRKNVCPYPTFLSTPPSPAPWQQCAATCPRSKSYPSAASVMGKGCCYHGNLRGHPMIIGKMLVPLGWYP